MMRKKLKKIEQYAEESQCLNEANKKSMKNVQTMLDQIREKSLNDSVYLNVASSHYGSVAADRLSYGKYSVHLS